MVTNHKNQSKYGGLIIRLWINSYTCILIINQIFSYDINTN